MNLFSDNKGVVNDATALILFGFAMAIILVVIYGVVDFINTGLQDTLASEHPEATDKFQNFHSSFIPVFDIGFFVLFIGLIIAGVVGLFLIDSHPVLFVASMIGLIVLLFVAGQFANYFSEFVQTPAVDQFAKDFTFIPLVMGNIVEFVLGAGGLFAVALYAKTSSRGRI